MQKISNITHYKSVSHDRYVYIERNENNEIIGLNWMQGSHEDEYRYFLEDHNQNDSKLLASWNDFNHHFKNLIAKNDILEVLNQFFWYYANTINKPQ